ncbi:MAG: hypothetical protein AAGC67_02820 [Myxococcota bacterium]
MRTRIHQTSITLLAVGLLVAPAAALAFDPGAASYFETENYAAGSKTGGLYEAVEDCEASTEGGVVLTHSTGEVRVDMAQPNTNIPDLTKCSIQGYGVGTTGASPFLTGPSVYVLENAEGETFIRVRGNGIELRSFGIVVEDTDASTTLIDVGNGTNALAYIVIDGVKLSGTTGNTDGIGFDFDDMLKSQVSNVVSKKLHDAALISGFTAATAIRDSAFRESVHGMRITSSMQASRLTLDDVTYESNTTAGLKVDSGAAVYLVETGSHYENSATAENISMDSASSHYNGRGIHFSGSVAIGDDYDRSVAIFTQRGADSCDGCSWNHGGALVSGSATRMILTNTRSIALSATFTGDFVGNTTYTHPSSCSAGMAARKVFVFGDRCIQGTGTSASEYACLDPGSNGWCDLSSEVVAF